MIINKDFKYLAASTALVLALQTFSPSFVFAMNSDEANSAAGSGASVTHKSPSPAASDDVSAAASSGAIAIRSSAPAEDVAEQAKAAFIADIVAKMLARGEDQERAAAANVDARIREAKAKKAAEAKAAADVLVIEALKKAKAEVEHAATNAVAATARAAEAKFTYETFDDVYKDPAGIPSNQFFELHRVFDQENKAAQSARAVEKAAIAAFAEAARAVSADVLLQSSHK